MFILAPSLLASDFSDLGNEIKKVYLNGKGCGYLHLDVMDGIFVGNISFGVPVIASLRKFCVKNKIDIIFDTHLMILNPIRYIDAFIEAGADIITFHFESCDNNEEIIKTIDFIKSRGKKCGISIKPKTSEENLMRFLSESNRADAIDMILIMSVEPGFGGQKFIESSLGKIKNLYKIKTENNYKFKIEVDGGINHGNAKEIKAAGADIIVAGSSVFKSENTAETIEIIEKFVNV